MKLPAILVSYVAVDAYINQRDKYPDTHRSWILDSGAYSALTSGVSIDLNSYIDAAGGFLAGEFPPKNVFALDVIGDPEASARNAEEMWRQGVPAVPTFHYGSAWSYLIDLAAKYDKIALGGMVARGIGGHGSKLGWTDRLKFLEQSFARVWPKWVHGFGITDPRLMLAVPFASVDSITWCYRVGRYGQIQGYGGLRVNPEVTASAIRVSLEQFLRLEDEVRGKMGGVLRKVTDDPFDLCLGVSGPELKFMVKEQVA